MSKASAYFTVDSIDGKHDVKAIKKVLDMLPGVSAVSVNEKTERIAVDFDTTAADSGRIQEKLRSLGYNILTVKVENTIL